MPVDVATYLMNEKRDWLNQIESRDKVSLVIVPNPHMQTPAYALRRIRDDEKELPENATVSYCHSKTPDLNAWIAKADIIIAAVGVPGLVTGDSVRPGAVIIDVGINRLEDATKKSGQRVVGDVDFEMVKEVAGAITPVPGGVGPMTIAMLMRNSLRSAKLRVGVSKSLPTQRRL